MTKLYFFPTIFFVIALILPQKINAGDWPSDPRTVVRTFAATEEGRFHRGLSFQDNREQIQAWDDGEVIWATPSTQKKNKRIGSSLVAIQHNDGFRSFYRGLETSPSLGETLIKGELLGYAGNDRWNFEIMDVGLSRSINPLSLLPTRNLSLAPNIGQIILTKGRSEFFLSDGLEIINGQWTISLFPITPGEDSAVPVEIALYWVGERLTLLRFDTLSEARGEMRLETPVPRPYHDTYDALGRLLLGEVMLNAGKGIIELRFKDERDFVTVQTWHISIKA